MFRTPDNGSLKFSVAANRPFNSSAELEIIANDGTTNVVTLNESIEIVIGGSGGDPDGIAFDQKGNLYVAHSGSGNLFVVNPKGKIIQTIKTPGNKPTNVEFGGKDFKTLFLTEVETNSLYKIDVNSKGQLLN